MLGAMAMGGACSSAVVFAHNISCTLIFQSLAQVSGIGSTHFLGQTYIEMSKPTSRNVYFLFYFLFLKILWHGVKHLNNSCDF